MDNKFSQCIIEEKLNVDSMKYIYSRQRDPILWTKSPIIRMWIMSDKKMIL